MMTIGRPKERRDSDAAAAGWRSRAFVWGAVLLLLAALLTSMPALAQADSDLPGRVGRIADIGGELYLSPQDKPDQWTEIGQNYPVTTGDNLWVAREGRAEVDYGGGQFRLAGDTNLHVSRLDDRNFAIFVAQGRVIVRVRVLDPGEVARIDTPNAQIAITRPGLYRIDVADDPRRTHLAVREGEANIATAGSVRQVLPGQTALLEGTEPQHASVRNGTGIDGFDTWSANRDRRYERSRATAHVSRQMVGYADLDEYGTWETTTEYGAVWYPSAVAADWAPYRNGYWTSVGSWGWTWVDYAPWGYAPFHYGRWSHIGGRWGWYPGAYVARPIWAPALVGWAGGPSWGVSAAYGSPVYGWVPLGWGEPYRPWWGRCSHRCWDHYNRPYAVNVAERAQAAPTRYANWHVPGAITAVPGAAFAGRKPAPANLVNVSGAMAANAPLLAAAPAVKPDLGRIPGVRTGTGVPPPASTFHPTAKPGNPGGSAATIPATGAVVAVPPAARPVSVPGSPMPAPRGAPALGPSNQRLSAKPAQMLAPPGASTYNAPVFNAAPTGLPAPPIAAPNLASPAVGARPARAYPRPPAPAIGAPVMSAPHAPAPVMRPLPQRDRTPPAPSMMHAAPAAQIARPIAAPQSASPAPQIARPSAGPPSAPQHVVPARPLGGHAGNGPTGKVAAPMGQHGTPYAR
ncbi:MAG: DUF6600 domain-containing protein [Casimicrobiaceae bacterium]